MMPPFMPTEEVDIVRVSGSLDWKTITGHTTAQTKGAYTEIIASTSGPAYWLHFRWADSNLSANDSSQLMDLAIGAASSEVIIIPDMGTGWARPENLANSHERLDLPFYIPSGSRISARLQGALVSDTCLVALDLYGGTPPSGYFSAVDVYGANASISRGVQVTSGSPANTKGSYTEIVASTSEVIDALVIYCQGDGGQTTVAFVFDIAVGAAASEVVVVSDYPFRSNSSEYFETDEARVIPLARPIPAGTRLSVRSASSTAAQNQPWIHVQGLRL